jgi:hypothetical protein
VFGCNAVDLFSKCMVNLFPSTAESRKELTSLPSTMFGSTARFPLSGMAVNASLRYALRLKLGALIDRDLR